MKKIVAVFAFICLCCFIKAQSVYFNNTYDFYGQWEVAWNVLELDSGYLVVGGIGDSITGEGRIGILFLDSLGNEVWKKSYGQPGKYYYPGVDGSLSKTADGGYALGGSVFYPSGDANAMLWRFNAQGDTLWTKTYGIDTISEIADACHQTPDAGFILVGSLYDGNGTNIMLIKTDNLGNLEWQNTYGGQYGVSIDVNADGDYIVGGDIYTGNDNTYVLKIDSAGSSQWISSFGGPYDENPGIARITADGGYIIAADTALFPYGPIDEEKKPYLIKLDSSGNIQWTRAYWKEARVGNTLVMARELADGSFIAAGQVVELTDSIENYHGTLLKVNSQGDSLWMRTYIKCNEIVTDHYFRDVQPTNDGGFIAVGFRSSGCGNSQDMWVVKTNCLGFDSLPAPAFAADSGTGTTLFLTNMTQNADDVIWYFGDGDTLYAHVGDSAWNPAHTYPGTGTYVVTIVAWACGDTSVFTDTLTAPYVGVEDASTSLSMTGVRVYPNPNNGKFTFEISNLAYRQAGDEHRMSNVEVLIYDMMGRLAGSKQLTTGKNEIDLTNQADGIYFYRVAANGQFVTGKLIIH